MCVGMLERKRPTPLGHADYYGVVANTAARVMALAPAGRVCIEGHLPFSPRHRYVYDLTHRLVVHLTDGGLPQRSAIRLVPRGHFSLKGLPAPVPVFEVRLPAPPL